MTDERRTVHALYRRLLTFYPREFREQVAESMQQTFNDLYHERRRQKNRVSFGPILWIFIETATGIFREHLMLLREGESMQNILTNLRWPTIISFLLIIPFMILEVVNRRSFNEGFPIPLFVMMWLLPMLFLLIGMPVVRNIRAGESISANPFILLIRVIFLIVIAAFWASLLTDQMPCFLGVPNCD